jgi:hypothetical protein
LDEREQEEKGREAGKQEEYNGEEHCAEKELKFIILAGIYSISQYIYLSTYTQREANRGK